MKVSELFENNGPNKVVLQIILSSRDNLNPKQITQLRSWFDNLPGEIGNAHVNVDREAIEISFSDLANTSVGFLDKLVDKVHSLIEDLMDKWDNEIEIGTNEMILMGMPSTPVEWPIIKIVANQRDTLANIHTLINGCDQLVIANCGYIAGNVLGLLKLECYVELINNGQSDPEWVKIVEKHLDQTDGGAKPDILACQEELIEAGLKAYAKF